MTKKKQDAQRFILAVNATKQSPERIFTKCMIELKWKIYFTKHVRNAETK